MPAEFYLHMIFFAVIGSFGTAYIHERTGRDVRIGGIIGALVGAFMGIFGLVSLWLWVYYSRSEYRSYGVSYNRRTRWYRWWE